MLEYFFSNQYAGYSRYFEGLQIWKSEKYRELQGSYPVIFISFASVKGATYQDARLGITRISKESIFSDLNNLEIVTTDSRKYETAFGFNREEVERVLMEFGCMDQLEQVRYWYDGFRFGSRTDIYNPWSITNHEVKNMFRKMIRGWFQKSNVRYNDFIKALLVDDVDYMNEYMNQISLQTFSSFDTGKKVLIRKDVSNK